MKTFRFIFILFLTLTSITSAKAQELNAKVMINRQQVSNTKSDVFDALEKAISRFLNERAWTQLKFRENEKIQCSFNLTVNTYSETDNSFTGSLLVACNRPVWGSNYTTTIWNSNDKNCDFTFQSFDQLEWHPEQIDNNLTAVLAFWAYFLIGMDQESMSPLGGTAYLRNALEICNQADGLGFKGWSAFNDASNRFAIVNDYLDGAMEPFRQLQYTYYRGGLDKMSEDTESGRKSIIEALEMLKQSKGNKSLSQLPQIFTDFKRDEIVSIFSGQGTSQDREKIYDILFNINPSQNSYWEKIKQ